MAIITLTTDFGTKDYSVAAVKGRLLQQVDNPTIIDISHEVSHHNIEEAVFILNAAYPNFPKGSIHIIGVNAEKTPLHKHLIVKMDGHYFIGADNGFFSLLSQNERFEKIIAVQHPNHTSVFPTKDVFVALAAEIANGKTLEQIGTPITSVYKWKKNNFSLSSPNELIGEVIYVDHFGNLITNITKESFLSFTKENRFEIRVGSTKITQVLDQYDNIIKYHLPAKERAKPGIAMAVFNSIGFLEISLYKSNPNNGGTASGLLGLRVNDSINIVLKE